MIGADGRAAYHHQLDDVRGLVVRLAALVVEAVPRATAALLDGDLDSARRLVEGDDELDVLTQEIEEACYQLLVLQNPMGSDMRAIVTALRVASEWERSGDLAVNIAKTARRLYGTELPARIRGLIERMNEASVKLLRVSIDAYADADANRAAALDDLDDELDDLQRLFIATIFETHHDEGLDLRTCIQLALVGRFYERLGDHAVNIAERVMYMVTGWMPDRATMAEPSGSGADTQDDVVVVEPGPGPADGPGGADPDPGA